MTEKQPQTCYVIVETPDWDEEFSLNKVYLKSHVIPALNELPDRYIFTKEELEAYVSEKLQECKRQKMNLCSEVYELRDKLIEHGILKPAIRVDVSRTA